nr:hypothetical protein GCM10020092_063770 [Actinoplanes digitatis]
MIADLMDAAASLVDRLATLDEWSVLLVTFLTAAVEMTFLLGLLVPGESVVMLARLAVGLARSASPARWRRARPARCSARFWGTPSAASSAPGCAPPRWAAGSAPSASTGPRRT